MSDEIYDGPDTDVWPHPPGHSWFVQIWIDGNWCTVAPTHDRDEALKRLDRSRGRYPGTPVRLVRETDTYDIEIHSMGAPVGAVPERKDP